MPDQLQAMLPAAVKQARELAPRLRQMGGALYLGRGYSYPLALEGALKLKEITYVHAEGHPAGEMKHGPIALVGPRTAVVVVAPSDRLRAKTLGNLEEVRARDGFVIAVGTEGDEDLRRLSDVFFPLPRTDELTAALRRDVDQPRNLAKSVTVE